jgi:hypothetical protein
MGFSGTLIKKGLPEDGYRRDGSRMEAVTMHILYL